MEGQSGAQERGGPHEPSPRDRKGGAEYPGKVCGLSQGQHEDHSTEGTDPDIDDLE